VTKVITNNGKKCIQDVEVGDKLLSNMGYNKVITIFPKVKKKMYRITTEGGHEIVCSEDHLFPTNNGEKNIKGGLCLEDRLFINNSDH
jgi:intein/homing endonuclease